MAFSRGQGSLVAEHELHDRKSPEMPYLRIGTPVRRGSPDPDFVDQITGAPPSFIAACIRDPRAGDAITINADGCWIFESKENNQGYRIVRRAGRNFYAHRYIYELLCGEIPAGLHLDHLCRVRACCNPAHLEPVTPRENSLRSRNFVAVNAQKTACPQGHPYAGRNLIEKRGRRVCRACRNKTMRENYARRCEREIEPAMREAGWLE